METNVVHKSDWLLAVEGKVEPDEVRKEKEKVLRHFAKHAKMQGFRQGKAPLSMVKARYEEDIKTEVVEEFATRAFRQALEDKNIHPLTRGRLTYWNFIESDELRFEVEAEVIPKIELHGYKQLKLEPVPPPSKEELVGKRLENLRDRAARLEPVERPSKEGDFLSCDYSVYKGGKKEEKHKGVLIKLGDQENFPEINQALQGKRPGEIAEVEVTYPENAGEMSGKKVGYKFFINEVKERRLPELSDEFAKETGFEDMGKMREKLAEVADKEVGQIAKERLEDQIFKQLVELHPFEPPPILVEERVRNLLYRLRAQDTPEIREQVKARAEEHVKLDLILEAISEKEEISVSDQELEAWFEERATQMGVPLPQVQSLWRPERAREEALRRKTIDFLLESTEKGGLIVYPDSH